MALQVRPVDQPEGWQAQVVGATAGNQTKLGAIFLSVINKPRERRAFGHTAIIDMSGNVFSSFTDKNGVHHPVVLVCTVEELQDNFSGLADFLRLPDEDRIALFSAVRQWISYDARADPNLKFTVQQRGEMAPALKGRWDQ
jgi:hypothetical protein